MALNGFKRLQRQKHEWFVLLQAGVCNSHGSDPDISDQALRTLAV